MESQKNFEIYSTNERNKPFINIFRKGKLLKSAEFKISAKIYDVLFAKNFYFIYDKSLYTLYIKKIGSDTPKIFSDTVGGNWYMNSLVKLMGGKCIATMGYLRITIMEIMDNMEKGRTGVVKVPGGNNSVIPLGEDRMVVLSSDCFLRIFKLKFCRENISSEMLDEVEVKGKVGSKEAGWKVQVDSEGKLLIVGLKEKGSKADFSSLSLFKIGKNSELILLKFLNIHLLNVDCIKFGGFSNECNLFWVLSEGGKKANAFAYEEGRDDFWHVETLREDKLNTMKVEWVYSKNYETLTSFGKTHERASISFTIE